MSGCVGGGHARRCPSGRRWRTAGAARSRRARPRARRPADPTVAERAELRLRQRPPHRAGPQRARRQLQRLLTEHLPGAAAAASGRRPPGWSPRPCRSTGSPRASSTCAASRAIRMSVTSRAVRGVVGLRGLHERDVRRPGRAVARRTSRPGGDRPPRRGRSCGRTARRPCRAAGRCPPRRPGWAPRRRRGCRPGRRPGPRRVQNQPVGRRRSSPRRPGRRTTSAVDGPNSSRSGSVSGSSAAAAHRCGPRTYGLSGSSTVASTGRPKIAAGWCTR